MKPTLKAYAIHLRTICTHKFLVTRECFRQGLYWQGIIHDLSKFGYTEFFKTGKYANGEESPISIEKEDKGYSEAWLNHKGRNKHHWEYWIDFKQGQLHLVKIPHRYLKEMACDIISASKAYNKKSYMPHMPLEYFLERKHNYIMLEEDRQVVVEYLKQHKEGVKKWKSV